MPDPFPKSIESFFKDLKNNNTKEWFEDSRDRYNNEILNPAQEFVALLGAELKSVRPNINAIPKIDKSIFRLHRDVRFSKDKSLYKTHLGLFFWEGSRKKMECSGLYFHLEPGNYFVGVGVYMFPPDLLKLYRSVVSEPEHGKALQNTLDSLSQKPNIELCQKHFKKTPRGFNADSPYSDLLLYNGLFGSISGQNYGAIEGHKAVDFCMEGFLSMLDLHLWLVAHLK